MAGFWVVLMGLGGIVLLTLVTIAGVLMILAGIRHGKRHPEQKVRYALLRLFGFLLAVPAIAVMMTVITGALA